MCLCQDGNTCLHLACEQGFVEIVKLILEKDVDVDVANHVSHIMDDSLSYYRLAGWYHAIDVGSQVRLCECRQVFVTMSSKCASM